jgi:hypothetical protein
MNAGSLLVLASPLPHVAIAFDSRQPHFRLVVQAKLLADTHTAAGG